MQAKTLHSLNKMKQTGEKITCLTAYDATFAHLLSSLGIDILLIGDSLGMVLQGQTSTLPVTVEDVAYHTRCVASGNQGALIMADMPFNSYGTIPQSLTSAGQLMQAGANIIKLEGGAWLAKTIESLTQNSMPVCGHLGLTPQDVNLFGGFRAQGKTPEAAKQIIEDAKALEQAGAKMLVLECVPSMLAAEISGILSIPVIGIGAGPNCDAQVLVLHDMLGITPGFSPKFCKNFMADSHDGIKGAIETYINQVKKQQFPAAEHCF